MVPQNALDMLLDLARLRHGERIAPCGRADELSDSVTEHQGYYVLWYNTPDHSTHAVKIEKPQNRGG